MRPVAVPILTGLGVNFATLAACSIETTVLFLESLAPLLGLLASDKLLTAVAVSGDFFRRAVYSLSESLFVFKGE